MPVGGITHQERAFLALALHARYGGRVSLELSAPLELLDEDSLAAARAMGLALRLGYTISGGVPGLLGGVTLSVGDAAVTLAFTPATAGRYGETVQRRLDALGRGLAKRVEVKGV
jgi:exopolyphosphatase/guanosine-5'-triphosphate,3'-diphosphate pyrophosphatase